MSLGLKSKIDLLSTVFCTPCYDTRYDPEPVTLSLGVNTALSLSLFSGGSRIFQIGEGAPTLEFRANTYYLASFFAENCMKMKEI